MEFLIITKNDLYCYRCQTFIFSFLISTGNFQNDAWFISSDLFWSFFKPQSFSRCLRHPKSLAFGFMRYSWPFFIPVYGFWFRGRTEHSSPPGLVFLGGCLYRHNVFLCGPTMTVLGLDTYQQPSRFMFCFEHKPNRAALEPIISVCLVFGNFSMALMQANLGFTWFLCSAFVSDHTWYNRTKGSYEISLTFNSRRTWQKLCHWLQMSWFCTSWFYFYYLQPLKCGAYQ